MRPVKIHVEAVSKVFGRDPRGALAKVHAGMDKTRLKDETDHVLGLHDITLDIRAGETFVIMGLSGSGKSTLIRHFNRLIESMLDETEERALVELRRSAATTPSGLPVNGPLPNTSTNWNGRLMPPSVRR